MEQKPNNNEPMDFKALWHRYHQNLTPGQRAELRRVRWPDELRYIPAMYRLLGGRRLDVQTLRVAYCTPYAHHQDDADSLGSQLVRANVSEKRLFQIIRSQAPNDLVYLRRILQQTEPRVDWNRFGKLIYYWGEISKRTIIEDFFIEQEAGKSAKRRSA